MQSDRGPLSVDKDFETLVRQISLLDNYTHTKNIAKAIEDLPKEQQVQAMNVLEMIIMYNIDNNIDDIGETIALLEIKPKEAIDKLYKEFELYFYRKMLDMEELPHLVLPEAGRQERIYIMRDILIYDQSISGNQKARESLRKSLPIILSEGYETWRAWGSVDEPQTEEEIWESTAELKDDGLIPENITPEQYQEWVKTKKTRFEEVFEFTTANVRSGVKEILKQAVVNNHISEDVIEVDYEAVLMQYDELLQPVINMSERLGELKEKIKAKNNGEGEGLTEEEDEEYRDLQKSIADYRKEKQAEINKLEALIYLEQFKMLTLEDVSEKNVSGKNIKVGVNKALKSIEKVFGEEYPEFVQDLQRIKQFIEDVFGTIFGEEKASRHAMNISDKVDLGTYFRIGEEPVATCQSYRSSGSLNAGLLAYVTDPNVKIIHIHDEIGRLIARSALRLISDDNGDPQLFLEPIYSVNLHPKIEEAFVRFASQKAQDIGIGLYSSSVEMILEAANYEEYTTLQNHNSRHAAVYSDAGGGLMSNGKFRINSAFRVV